jgi:hypothetical protein
MSASHGLPPSRTATGTATRDERPRVRPDEYGRRALVTCGNGTSAYSHERLLVAGGQGVAGSNPVSPTVKSQVRGGSSGIGRPVFCALEGRSRGSAHETPCVDSQETPRSAQSMRLLLPARSGCQAPRTSTGPAPSQRARIWRRVQETAGHLGDCAAEACSSCGVYSNRYSNRGLEGGAGDGPGSGWLVDLSYRGSPISGQVGVPAMRHAEQGHPVAGVVHAGRLSVVGAGRRGELMTSAVASRCWV